MSALVSFIKANNGVVAKSASAELVKQFEARGLKPADAQAVAAAVANGTKFLTRDKDILKKHRL
jgi:predicted nucleic acid-binding protein